MEMKPGELWEIVSFQRLEKVKAISTEGLAKDFICKYGILNGEKYFYSAVI